MSSNKSARQQLERIFGKICMIEELGIRKIPKEQRRKIKGYTKYDDIITYHHITKKEHGGKATLENGALLKGYNHRWFHTLPQKEQDSINTAMIEFKASIMAITDKGVEMQSPQYIQLDFNIDPEDCITIQAYDNTREDQQKRQKFNRAKEKLEFQKKIDEFYDEDLEI